jgi:hypothetical protein
MSEWLYHCPGFRHAYASFLHRFILICGLCDCTVFFHTISKSTRFYGKWLLNIECGFWFFLQICLKKCSFRENLNETRSEIYTNLHVKYPLFLSGFNYTRIFSTNFRKTQILSFIKILRVAAVLFLADRRTYKQSLLAVFLRHLTGQQEMLFGGVP